MFAKLFKTPKAPEPQKLPESTPTPTVDQAAQRAEDDLRMRRRKGRNQYMLTKRQDVAAPTVATKTLTGQ